MRAPPKVKKIIWRECRNALPTKQALMRRTIISDPICERCKVVVEDLVYALWSCSELDVVWVDQEVWNFRNCIEFMDFKELLSWIIVEGKLLELFAFTAWTIWNQRESSQVAATSQSASLGS